MSESLFERLRANRVTIGGWLTLPSVKAAEAMAACGFDWIAVDLEHSTISLESAEACFMAIGNRNVAPLARLPNADPDIACRLLDAGAAGLIIPVVEDVAAFSDFAMRCHYPPKGRRGVGLSRCNGYGASFETYFETFKPVLVPQIESRAGVSVARELAGMGAVSALFIGPYDLSADLGSPGQLESEAVVSAMDEVRQAAEQAGKPLGVHQVSPDLEDLRRRVADGFRFIAYSTDVIAMQASLGLPADIRER